MASNVFKISFEGIHDCDIFDFSRHSRILIKARAGHEYIIRASLLLIPNFGNRITLEKVCVIGRSTHRRRAQSRCVYQPPTPPHYERRRVHVDTRRRRARGTSVLIHHRRHGHRIDEFRHTLRRRGGDERFARRRCTEARVHWDAAVRRARHLNRGEVAIWRQDQDARAPPAGWSLPPPPPSPRSLVPPRLPHQQSVVAAVHLAVCCCPPPFPPLPATLCLPSLTVRATLPHHFSLIPAHPLPRSHLRTVAPPPPPLVDACRVRVC